MRQSLTGVSAAFLRQGPGQRAEVRPRRRGPSSSCAPVPGLRTRAAIADAGHTGKIQLAPNRPDTHRVGNELAVGVRVSVHHVSPRGGVGLKDVFRNGRGRAPIGALETTGWAADPLLHQRRRRGRSSIRRRQETERRRNLVIAAGHGRVRGASQREGADGALSLRRTKLDVYLRDRLAAVRPGIGHRSIDGRATRTARAGDRAGHPRVPTLRPRPSAPALDSTGALPARRTGAATTRRGQRRGGAADNQPRQDQPRSNPPPISQIHIARD
jgi:hypothetical protein